MKTLVTADTIIMVCRDTVEIGEEAAKLFEEVVGRTKRTCVALSGGNTPKALYNRLCQPDYAGGLCWNKIHFFLSDERCVPHSSEESNYGNANRLLLKKVGVPDSCTHPTIGQDKDPEISALDYEESVKAIVSATNYENGESSSIPSFDLILLGMGPDGHTASLFPDTEALQVTDRLVVSNFVPKFDSSRITFTFSLINAAKNIVILAAGSDKAPAIKSVIMDKEKSLPIERISALNSKVIWVIDEAAASDLLKNPTPELQITQ